MQRVTMGKADEIRIDLGALTRRPGGVADLSWIKGITSILVRVRTPANTEGGAFVAPSAGFPLLVSTIGTGDVEAGAESFFVSAPASSLRYGDTLAVARRLSDTTSDYTTVRFVGVTGEGNTVLLGSPIACDCEDGSDVVSLTIYAAISETMSAQIGAGVVDVKVIDADGAEFVYLQAFRIVRFETNWTMTPERLQVLMPSILRRREGDDVTLQETIDAARDIELMPVLNSYGIAEENIRNTKPLESLFLAAIDLHLARNDPSTDDDRLKRLERTFDSRLPLVMTMRDAWYLDDQQVEKPMPPENGDAASKSGMRYTR